ncbi:MAG: helix-turn-helix transcriptional regulator [Coriobacteriales bacterium]|nr:helix-turn-helix transcriptional regulator [Coriobacteriales bacterium]
MNEKRTKMPAVTKGQLVVFALGLFGAQSWLPLIRFITEAYRSDVYCITAVAPLLIVWLTSVALTSLFFMGLASRGTSSMGIPMPLAGAGLSVLGILLLILSDAVTAEGRLLLLLLVGATMGVGNCLLALSLSSFAGILSERQTLILLAAVGVATCLMLGFTQLKLPSSATYAVSSCMALLSLLCCQRLFPAFPELKGLPRLAQTGTRSLFLGIAASAACFGFVFALMMVQFSGAEHAKTTAFTWLFSLGGLALAALFLFIGRAIKKPEYVFLAYRLVPVPIIIAFFPFDAGSEFSLVYAFYVSTLALFCYMGILPLLIQQCAQMMGARIVYVTTATASGLCAGAALGCLVAALVEMLGLKEGFFINISAIVAMVLSVFATNMILTRGNLARVSAKNILMSKSSGDAMEPSSLGDRVYLVSKRHHLTSRETEVLLILAQGHNLARIQQELYISEGTAITHRRKIYQKLDVHSKEELLDLMANCTELE